MDGDLWLRSRRLSRRRALRGFAGAAGIVGLGVAGCAQPASPAEPTAPPAAAPTSAPAAGGATQPTAAPAKPTPKYGGIFKTGTTTVERNLDPHASNGAGGAHGSANSYSNLITYKWGPEVQPLGTYIPGPDLAESWTQPDERTYIFKLRPGVKFHNVAPVNGRELVAEDILYSFDRIRELKFYAPLLQGIGKTEAVDKYTVKVTMDKPNADVLINLCDRSAKIVAKEAVAVNGNLEGPPVIGTGPWIFESWSPTAGFRGNRNPDYFLKGLPYADRIESIRASDITLLVDGFRGGSLNAVGNGFTPELADQVLKAVPKASIAWAPFDRAPDDIGLNQKYEAFKNKKVRQAISKAIDRQAMIAATAGGKAILSAGLNPPTPDWILPQDELKKLYARDLEGAKRLMQEAGLAAGFEVKSITNTTLANAYVAESELIQSYLKDINIRITIDVLDPATFFQRQATGQYDMYISVVGITGPNANLYARYYTGGAANSYGYSNTALDKLIDDQAVLARDPDGRKKIWQEMQRIIIDDAVVQNVMIRQQPIISAPEVMDFYPYCEMLQGQNYWTTAWFNR
jgi:peptide/nickel transport system substrate-binding protein